MKALNIELSINIKAYWIKSKTDLRECAVCRDVIYGNMYQLCLSTPQYENRTNQSLCESCKNQIDLKNEG